jgi:hypothetical protein
LDNCILGGSFIFLGVPGVKKTQIYNIAGFFIASLETPSSPRKIKEPPRTIVKFYKLVFPKYHRHEKDLYPLHYLIFVHCECANDLEYYD